MTPTTQPVKTVVTDRGEATPRAIVPVRMQPLAILGVRILRVYLFSLLGFLTAAGLAGAGFDAGLTAFAALKPIAALQLWEMVQTCAGLALAPTLYSALTNAIELLASVDVKAPQLRG